METTILGYPRIGGRRELKKLPNRGGLAGSARVTWRRSRPGCGAAPGPRCGTQG